MSCARCHLCEALIDTDNDPDSCYAVEREFTCENCRDRNACENCGEFGYQDEHGISCSPECTKALRIDAGFGEAKRRMEDEQCQP